MRKTCLVWMLVVVLAASFGALACNSENDGPADGDAIDGDSDDTPDGDSDGDVADGDELDGDVSDGDVDGDVADGDATDGDTDGDADGDSDDDTEQPWALPYNPPDGRGSYNVGAMSVRYVNAAQQRDLTGTVWYPTFDSEGERTYYQDLIPAEGVFKNATIAEGGPFPVVVFSHGNQSFAEQSGYFVEFMASHGFIVAACDHIGNTTGTYEDELVPYIAQQRPRDLSIVVDYLTAWNEDPEHPLYGKVNLDAIGGAGHSFGGFTVLYWAGATLHADHLASICTEDDDSTFCELLGSGALDELDFNAQVSDARVKAIVPMAPAGWPLFGSQGVKDIFAPTMFQVGDVDSTVPTEGETTLMYPEMSAPKYMLLLEGAGHFTFSNMCAIYPGFGDGCGDDFMDADRAYYLSNLFALAFLRVYLLDEERDLQYLSDDYAGAIDDIQWQSQAE